jgi:hypothetical protein
MYVRALRGYEESLPLRFTSYTPALITMFRLGMLFIEKKDLGMAMTMLTKALVGFKMTQGSSSHICQALESQIAALDLRQRSRHSRTHAKAQ